MTSRFQVRTQRSLMLDRLDTLNGHDLVGVETEERNGDAPVNRLLRTEDLPPPVNGDGDAHEAPAVALFCFESPDSVVGRDMTRLSAALAQRGHGVHVFTRRGFATDAAGVSIHVLGDCGGDLTTQVETFT